MSIEWIKNRPIAHRGLHSELDGAPENSLKSFNRAIKNDYCIELDVRILKDNKIIVFHDENLKRMTGIDKDIKDISYSVIEDLTLNNTFEKIPLLQEVLDYVDGKVPILIEIKNKNNNGYFEKILCKILNGYKGEFAIQSFNPLSLFWMKKYEKNFFIGKLIASPLHKEFYYNLKLISRLGKNIKKFDFKAYSSDHPRWYVKMQKKRNVAQLVWTIKSKKVYEKVKYTYDNFIFEGFKL